MVYSTHESLRDHPHTSQPHSVAFMAHKSQSQGFLKGSVFIGRFAQDCPEDFSVERKRFRVRAMMDRTAKMPQQLKIELPRRFIQDPGFRGRMKGIPLDVCHRHDLPSVGECLGCEFDEKGNKNNAIVTCQLYDTPMGRLTHELRSELGMGQLSLESEEEFESNAPNDVTIKPIRLATCFVGARNGSATITPEQIHQRLVQRHPELAREVHALRQQQQQQGDNLIRDTTQACVNPQSTDSCGSPLW